MVFWLRFARSVIHVRMPRVKMFVFIAFAALFTYSSARSSQVWEEEIKFTGSRTVRIALPSNSAASVISSQQPNSARRRTRSSREEESHSLSNPFTDTFLDSIKRLNSSWQVSSREIFPHHHQGSRVLQGRGRMHTYMYSHRNAIVRVLGLARNLPNFALVFVLSFLGPPVVYNSIIV